MYINSKSNHLPTILKQLPKAIIKLISEISSNEDIFSESIPNKAFTPKHLQKVDLMIYTPKFVNNNVSEEKRRKQKITGSNLHLPYPTLLKC